MNVLIIPSWYPQFEGDIGGSFFKEQAEQLAIHYPQYNFIVLSVDLNYRTRSWIKKILTLKFKTKIRINQVFTNLQEIRLSYFISPPHAKLEAKVAKKLYNLLLQINFHPNIIHAHAAWNGGYLAMELSKIIKCKYIVTEHMGPFPWQIPLFITKHKHLTNKIRLPLINADCVLAVSTSLANQIASFGIKRPLVLSNLVNEHNFKPSVNKGSKEKIFNLLTVGRLIPEKGMNILLEAFSKAYKLEPYLRLTIVGDGEDKNALIQLSQNLNITNVVNFVGLVDRNKIINYYHAADCFVLASKGETFGVVYAEAIACGLPIIATRCGGPEDIVNTKNGILTEINNVDEICQAIITIYKNQNKYIKDEIREDFLRRFSSATICQQIISIYQG
jgi:glycosyltransferase involved in cell wall biosynthesis